MELANFDGALWYEFDQNNSGGYFIRGDFVADVVFVQAMNEEQASDIMREMVDKDDAWGFCDCCGERWHFYYIKGFEVPARYGKDVTKEGIDFFESKSYALFHGLNGRTLKYDGKTAVELGKIQ